MSLSWLGSLWLGRCILVFKIRSIKTNLSYKCLTVLKLFMIYHNSILVSCRLIFVFNLRISVNLRILNVNLHKDTNEYFYWIFLNKMLVKLVWKLVDPGGASWELKTIVFKIHYFPKITFKFWHGQFRNSNFHFNLPFCIIWHCKVNRIISWQLELTRTCL